MFSSFISMGRTEVGRSLVGRCQEAISYSNAGVRPCQMVLLSGTRRIRIAISESPGRSVNRKVQGSNPCSGAKPEIREVGAAAEHGDKRIQWRTGLRSNATRVEQSLHRLGCDALTSLRWHQAITNLDRAGRLRRSNDDHRSRVLLTRKRQVVSRITYEQPDSRRGRLRHRRRPTR